MYRWIPAGFEAQCNRAIHRHSEVCSALWGVWAGPGWRASGNGACTNHGAQEFLRIQIGELRSLGSVTFKQTPLGVVAGGLGLNAEQGMPHIPVLPMIWWGPNT